MQGTRLYFSDPENRAGFFDALRGAAGVKSWEVLAANFGLRRNVFQRYQYGERTMPHELFDSFVQLLPAEKQIYFRQRVSLKPANWGVVKGGNTTYLRHPEIFEKGRVLASKSNKRRSNDVRYTFDLQMPLSEELCEFIGAFIGDGCTNCYSGRGQTFFCGDSGLDKSYMLGYICDTACFLFGGLKPSVHFRKYSNSVQLNFCSKRLFRLITSRFNLPKGLKCYSVKIPDEILNAGNNFIFSTVRGIFDTDGNVFVDRRRIYPIPYPRITLKIASLPLHLQLKKFLGNFFSLYSAKKVRDCSTTYEITIYGRKQLKKWMKLIGFSNERHLCKVRELEAPGGNRTLDLPLTRRLL